MIGFREERPSRPVMRQLAALRIAGPAGESCCKAERTARMLQRVDEAWSPESTGDTCEDCLGPIWVSLCSCEAVAFFDVCDCETSWRVPA